MFQPMFVVTMEAIRSKMSTATFFSRQGAQHNAFGTIQHKVEFQRTYEARIEHLSLIMNSHAIPPLPEIGDRPLSKGHPLLIAKHAQAPPSWRCPSRAGSGQWYRRYRAGRRSF